jgi:hypothetical protein
MEGGFLPWKVNPASTCIYADYSKLHMPLPTPPKGFSWSKDVGGEFFLVDESTGQRLKHLPSPDDLPSDDLEKMPSGHTSRTLEFEASPRDHERQQAFEESMAAAPEFIDHVILPSDTFPGICLRYKVKPAIIRRVNQFTGDNLRSLKVLKIPTAYLIASGRPLVSQIHDRDVQLQIFMNDTGLGSIEAKIYLDNHEWDAKKAREEWADDNIWELQQEQIKKMEMKSKVTSGEGRTLSPPAVATVTLSVAAVPVESLVRGESLAVSSSMPVATLVTMSPASLLARREICREPLPNAFAFA